MQGVQIKQNTDIQKNFYFGLANYSVLMYILCLNYFLQKIEEIQY